MEKIGIIVPVYNVEKYIRRCISSILRQSYNNFILILVDDGSPDQCGKICDEYKSLDSRIVVIHQENKGLSEARNVGIRWALGQMAVEWLTFIDSDDWVSVDYLEELYRNAKDNNVDISICNFQRVYENDIPEEILDYDTKIWDVEALYAHYVVEANVAWGKLYRKNLWTDIRYPVGKIHEDEFTTYKVLFLTNKIVFIEGKLYYYFQNDEGIMRKKWTLKRLDFLEAYEERAYFFENNKKYGLLKILLDRYVYYFDELLENNSEKLGKKMLRVVKRRYRQSLKRMRKKCSSMNIRNYPRAYEIAYPRLVKVFWKIVALKRKLNK